MQEKGRTCEAGRRYGGVGVGSRVDVLWAWGGGKLTPGRLGVLQEMETLGDNGVAGVELRSAGISIDGIGDLVIAALVQAAEVEPDLRDVGVDADGPRVRIQCVAELIDLKVEDADGAPEGRVSAVAVDGLLISFVCLVVLLTCHVSTPEEIPALGIRRVCFETLCEILDGEFLVLEGRPVLVVEPSELLEHLCVGRVVRDDAFVGIFCTEIIVLLFIDMSDLEPDVGMGEGTWWVAEDAVEAAEGLFVLALLFVDDAETEEDLVCLVKV